MMTGQWRALSFSLEDLIFIYIKFILKITSYII